MAHEQIRRFSTRARSPANSSTWAVDRFATEENWAPFHLWRFWRYGHHRLWFTIYVHNRGFKENVFRKLVKCSMCVRKFRKPAIIQINLCHQNWGANPSSCNDSTNHHRRSTSWDKRAIQATLPEWSDRQLCGQQALAFDLLRLQGTPAGRNRWLPWSPLFSFLMDNPLLSNLKYLALCAHNTRFDLNKLNRFRDLLHLEIDIKFSHPKKFSFPKLKVLAFHQDSQIGIW